MKHFQSIRWSLLALSLCSFSAWSAPVKIGFIGPRTGSAAATGTAFQEGIDLALEQLKKQGSPIEVVFEDTGGVPDKASAAFEKLVNKDQVVMVMGESHSSSAIIETELSKRYSIPFVISEAWSDALLEKKYSTVFRAGPYNTHVVHNAIAAFAIHQKFKKISIVHENSDWGKGIAAITQKALKKAKIKHQLIEVDLKAKDYYAELNQVRKQSPELVIAFIYSFGLHTFVSQAAEVGVTPDALILDGAGTPSLWSEFWPNVGKAGEGELFVSSMHEAVKPTPETEVFWDGFKKKYGREPTDYKSRSGYTMIMLAADVVKRAKSTKSKDLIRALEKTKFSSPAGVIQFGQSKKKITYHQWAPDMLISQWQNKKAVVVYPKLFKTGELKK